MKLKKNYQKRRKVGLSGINEISFKKLLDGSDF